MVLRGTARTRRWMLPLLVLTFAGAGPGVDTPRPAAAGVRIEVDLSARKLHLYRGETEINTFEVAVGTEAHPTPTGDFSIDRVIWNPAWVPPDVEWAEDAARKAPGDADNPMQGAKVFFKSPDYYIHGTNAPESLGSAASHGCLRMNEADVEELAEFIQKAAGEDRGDAWFERVRSSETDRTEVRLSDPVPITIHE